MNHPKQRLQGGLRFWRRVAVVSTAAGVTDVVLHPTVRGDVVRAATTGFHAALSGQGVDDAVAASGAGAALLGPTLGRDVGAGLAFGLQGTEVAQQGALAQRGDEQSGRGQQDGGQEAA